MLYCTLCRRMRMPKARRPRERPWEIFNTRDFGFQEGSQNYSMWIVSSLTFISLFAYEIYMQFRRIKAKGDTCPSCEAARAHYRQRVEDKELELEFINKYSHKRIS
ncbi:unnamed protein product [Phytomonas sp. Hart1]|nr:unnamed protein product [Phytomonas sp. Hart1]|eukprot:CCW71244.1 unnamed protein product [Phytomonas sp. isolate Hart1]